MAKKSLCTHTYRRFVSPNGKAILKCIKCPHFLHFIAYAIGRKSQCGGCAAEFVITAGHLVQKAYASNAGENALNQPANWPGWRLNIVCGLCEENLSRSQAEVLAVQKAILPSEEGESPLTLLLKNVGFGKDPAAAAASSSESEQLSDDDSTGIIEQLVKEQK